MYLHRNLLCFLTDLFQVPVSQLVQPPSESRLLRVTDKIFVKNLKEK